MVGYTDQLIGEAVNTCFYTVCVTRYTATDTVTGHSSILISSWIFVYILAANGPFFFLFSFDGYLNEVVVYSCV